ncbi:Na+/H+ antiporter subunit C [Elioraea tepida]|uniref:Na+/H+ antiporter subunit C n=1 Tax=Elioraea tepida TaxID=2843330 RepID=A0A975YIV8_9PROT|nr:Na+/H+ antiporter subunit C [Elioraea tepida]QXM23812.1 Na+/H+ antiporter subunit C [Elioraea tepida]
MEATLAILIGVLVAVAVWLMLSRNLVRFLLGFAMLSNAVNLAMFVAGRLTPSAPPLVQEGAEGFASAFANPLPQALVLTAIVIGFGLLAFALVLTWQAQARLGTVRTDEMRVAEPPPAREAK